MTDIQTIGIAIGTDGIDKGTVALDRLADVGPRVDKSLQGVEQSAARANKSIATLGQGGNQTTGIDKVAQSSQAASENLKKFGQQAAQTYNTVGISAGQAAQAMRQLPAQIQDFVVQLQGGQSVLTALSQQGSQVATSFGGVGNALRAVGSLITPTAAALAGLAAVGGSLALAYSQGAKEFDAYNRALILTGNAAGATTGRLQEMARAQAAFVGTQGDAARSLAALVSTGKVSGAVLDSAAEATTRFVRVGGEIGDIVAKFAKLGDEPLKALIELNKTENFLTESVYRQVKALEEQGKAAQAAAVAQRAYADATIERTKEIETRLGTLQKLWKGVGDFAKEAWDRMLDVGRQQTPQEQLAGLLAQLATLEQDFARKRNAALGKNITTQGQDSAALERQRASLFSQIAALQKTIDAEDALAKAQAGRAAGVKAVIKADDDAKKAVKSLGDAFADVREAAKEWADAFQDFSAIQRDAEASTDGLSKGQARLLQYLMSPGYANASDDMRKLALEQAYAAITAEQNAEAQKAASKAAADYIAGLERSYEAVAKQVQALKDEEAAVALAAASNVSLAVAIEDVAIARLQEQRAKDLSFGDESAAAAIQKEIEKRRELKQAIAGKEARELAKKNAEETARDWQRVSDQIGQGLTDRLFRAFEAGRGFFDTLWKGIVNTFKTTTLKLIIQGVDGKSGIVGSALSSIGVPGFSAAGGSGGLGGLGSLFGLGGGAGGLGTAFSSAFSGGTALGGDAIGAGFTALFNGSGTLAGNFGQILGGANGALSSIGGLGGALGYGSSLYSLSQGKYGAAAGSAIGTFLGGPIGAAIGGSIGGAIDKAFGSVGAKQSGASYLSNGTTGQAVNGGMFGLDRAWGDSIGKYFSQGVQDALKTSTTVGAGLLNSVSTAFGGMGGYQVGAFFASDNTRASQGNRSILGPNGQILSSWSGSGLDKDPTKGLEQLTNALAGDVRTALQQINIPGWAKSQLQALTDDVSFEQLANVVQSILATKEAFKSLGDAMPQLKDLTDSAVEGLLKAFEGLDNLKGAASSYYENFYSQAERNAEATRQLGDAIGALGLQVPSTREAYRSLVEAQDLNTESGRAAYAQLLKLSPAFAALVPATEAAVDSVQALAAKMAEAGKQALAQLADQTAGLQVDLLNAQGDAVGAAALKRQQELANITNGISSTDAAAAVAAYDYNTQLQDQIDKLKAAAAAAAQRYSLESTLLSLQGNTAALRERELAALDESSRAIQQEIYQLQDQQEAAQKAADAMQAFKSALDGLGETRFNLENQLLALQGDAASVAARVRDRELAKLTQGMSAEDAKKIAAAYDYNVALQAQIDATKAAQQQAQEYAAAQQRAADASQKAAQQIADAWKSAANSVLDEVARIRNQVSGDSPTSFSQAQAKFAITLAQASAGDLDAFKLLPQLSQSMLSIGEQQAVSFADLQSLRTRTAASLEALANRLGFTASTSSFTGGAASAATAYTPAPLQASTFSAQAQSTQDDLLAEIKLLREQVVKLRKQVDVSNTNTGRAAEALEGNQSVPILVEMA